MLVASFPVSNEKLGVGLGLLDKKRYVPRGDDNSCKWITHFEDGTEDTVSDPDADDDYEFDYDHMFGMVKKTAAMKIELAIP